MTISFPQVIDVSAALVVEGYMSLGMNWWDALEAVADLGSHAPPSGEPGTQPRSQKTDEEKAAENNATMASLMGALSQSSFKGVPR
jgi:hypothetical protein